MATTKSANYLLPQLMPCDGRAVVLHDSVTISANPTAADRAVFRIPAGLEVCKIWLSVPDMDSSTGLAGKIGYKAIAPDSTLVEDDDYFRADGALGQAAALIDLDFVPITFQEDVDLEIVWTVTATGFSAGTIRAVILGNSKGPR